MKVGVTRSAPSRAVLLVTDTGECVTGVERLSRQLKSMGVSMLGRRTSDCGSNCTCCCLLNIPSSSEVELLLVDPSGEGPFGVVINKLLPPILLFGRVSFVSLQLSITPLLRGVGGGVVVSASSPITVSPSPPPDCPTGGIGLKIRLLLLAR